MAILELRNHQMLAQTLPVFIVHLVLGMLIVE